MDLNGSHPQLGCSHLRERDTMLFTVDIELSPWQSRLSKNLQEEPNPRTVYWIWEPHGKAGKTLFQKWWCCHIKDTLILSGKASDMKNGVITWIQDHGDPPRVILCNIPKSTEEKYVSFTGLEEVKASCLEVSGMFFCSAMRKMRTSSVSSVVLPITMGTSFGSATARSSLL